MPAVSDNFISHDDVDSRDSAVSPGAHEPAAPSRAALIAQAAALLDQALVADQQLFADAAAAKVAAVEVERLRRLSVVAATQVLHDMVQSRICDEHGHVSAKIMYAAVNSQSSRDVYRLEQARRMFDKCGRVFKEARRCRLSEDHISLLARVFANQRVRDAFLNQQSWFIKKARRFDFKAFEILVARWVEVNDPDGSDPNKAHEQRHARSVQDLFGLGFEFTCGQAPLVGAAMNEILAAYVDAELAKDWEAARALHGDAACKDNLARNDRQRRADAFAQIFADAAANPNSSMPLNFVHLVVWSQSTIEEMARRHAGYLPRPFDLDEFRCETIDGAPLEPNETFLDVLMNPLRRVVLDAKGVVIDISEKRFFTGLARTALQVSHPGCDWPGCNVPASKCQADHTTPKNRGGPTTQSNGTLFCGRHNRHKERGYTVWRDPTTGQIRISTPSGEEITEPWTD